MNFILPLPPPINKTYQYGKGNYYKVKKARDWEEEAGWIIKKEHKGEPITTRCYFLMRIYVHFNHHEPDVDAFTKIVQDLLEKQRVVVNDKLFVSSVVNKIEIAKEEKPYIEVIVATHLGGGDN